jgi:hypothetical protein
MAAQGMGNGGYWFSPATRFTLAREAHMVLEPRSQLILENGSELHILPDAKMELGRKAKLTVAAGTRVVLHGNAALVGKRSLLKKLRRKGRLVEVER